jgi:hypothetical protein
LLNVTTSQETADKRQWLIDIAGPAGVDEDGKRLDQGKFQESKAAFGYPHLC